MLIFLLLNVSKRLVAFQRYSSSSSSFSFSSFSYYKFLLCLLNFFFDFSSPPKKQQKLTEAQWGMLRYLEKRDQDLNFHSRNGFFSFLFFPFLSLIPFYPFMIIILIFFFYRKMLFIERFTCTF